MRRFGFVLALAAVVACGKSYVPAPVSWFVDVDAGAASAKAQRKPVVVFVGAEWDTGAKMLERDAFGNAEVRALLNRDFVSIRVDATDYDDPRTLEAQKRFQVVGTPTIIILGPDCASEIKRFNEVIRPDVLLHALRAALKSDAVREAAFEAAARRRADEARWEEARRNFDAAGAPTVTITFPEP